MTRERLLVLFMALLLIVLSWFGVATARTGLVVRSLDRDGIPMLYIVPQGATKVPGVLVAHGFAGSKQLMLGYGYVLAHAGYAVMLWDFSGHGANPNPLKWVSLDEDLAVAQATLLEQSEVDSSRLALLGHSMGSGVVMSAGINRPDRYGAIVAISPTDAKVTPEVPQNLQLQAGSWEPRFVENAKRLLREAGGENENLAEGKGRSLAIVPNAEHITILFRDVSHQAARKWLDATFGVQNPAHYRDRRMGCWYGLHLLGWLMLLGAVAPILREFSAAHPAPVSRLRKYGGLLLASFSATTGLLLLSRIVEIQNLGGLLVGGAVGIWFAIAGLVWLLVVTRLPRPTLQNLGLGIGLFILLWIGFGAIAQVTWLQWWLIPPRLKLWLPLSLACFPWFLTSGIAQYRSNTISRLVWWLAQSLALFGGFLFTILLVPQLGFIFLLLPLFPPAMALFSFAAAMLDEPWSYAIGSALFFGWTLAAAFPLAG